MPEPEKSWVEGYYENMAFFYDEPQHIGRRQYVESRLNTFVKVDAHLRAMEVTLNHQIKQFLSLAPRSLRNRLFGLAGIQISGDFIMAGSLAEVDRALQLDNAVQPDFLFTSDHTTAALEMKVGAKSNVTQVLKYALLALAVEQDHQQEMGHALAFLGRGDFCNLWSKGISCLDDLKRNIETERHLYLKTLKGKARRFQKFESRYSEILSSLLIGFVSYRSFADLLRAETPQLDGSAGSEVYRNLMVGMVGELERRGLA